MDHTNPVGDSGHKQLHSKVLELFRYRHIPELLSMSGLSDTAGLREKLVRLQLSIYALDQYLESNWEMDKEAMDAYWNGIYASLLQLGIMGGRAIDWCSEIRQYQAHELNMRKGRWPTQIDFRTLYYYKSCDVRLIRRIIYAEAPGIANSIPFDDWIYYDFITEINDDIDDVFEDMETINGNRFLISLILNGPQTTRGEFLRQMESLEHEMAASLEKKVCTEGQVALKVWSEVRFRETRQLLERQLGKADSVDLRKAFIFSFMDQDHPAR
jgi:hypothetical protein